MADKRIIALEGMLDKLRGEEGYGLLRKMVEEVMQALLEAERDEHVGVGKYERGEERKDVRSGYKGRQIKTAVGKIDLRVPQTRNGMSSQLLATYDRVDQALLLTAMEMYVSGVSTRRVEGLLDRTIGVGVSAQTVSKAAKRLDAAVSALKSRPLGRMPVLMVDARFDKVRRDGVVRNAALLVVVGIDPAGNRRVLDFAAVDGEKKTHWKQLFLSLRKRGLEGVLYTVSDDHEGLRGALGEVFTGAVWNRCHTHISRNVLTHAPAKKKTALAARIKDIYNAPDEKQARQRLRDLAQEADAMKKGLGEYIEEVVPDGFAVFALPESLRRQLSTTNMIERINQELKRRTRVVRIFPGLESYERLTGTLLVRIDEDWIAAGRRYLDAALLIESLEIPMPSGKVRVA